MKKQYQIILSAIIVAFVATGGVLWLAKTFDKAPAAKQVSIVTEQSAERHRTEIVYIAKTGETALEQLKYEADNVITKQSDYGELVISIEGYDSGTDSKYWSFYIDNKMAEVGAGSYIQKGGERIEWKFQRL